VDPIEFHPLIYQLKRITIEGKKRKKGGSAQNT
jgi:hypothetical protein